MSTLNAAIVLLKRNLARHPYKIAYRCGNDDQSYLELDHASQRFAQLLVERGIRPGERVVLALPDCLALPVAILGCLLTGAVAVMAGADRREEELRFIVEDSGAALLVSHSGSGAASPAPAGGLREIVCDDHGPLDVPPSSTRFDSPYQPAAGDFAFMLYSSGSTDRLKGVPHHHASLLLPGQLMGDAILGITGDDVIFSTSKLSFGYGLVNSLSFPLHSGATAILHPGKPDISSIIEIIERHKPSILFSVPTVYSQILLAWREPELKLPTRLCCSAGGALPVPLFEEWRKRTGLEIIDGIGASEFSGHFISNTPGRAAAGSIGRLVPGYRVRLVDDAGNDVPSGSEGHLLVSGGTRSPHYWNLPEKSAETMLPDGFTRTGDVLLEKNGFYYYRGRSVSGGTIKRGRNG